MRERGIERNVHTFSALMNVCIKCGQYKLALDVYRDMRAAVSAPAWPPAQAPPACGGLRFTVPALSSQATMHGTSVSVTPRIVRGRRGSIFLRKVPPAVELAFHVVDCSAAPTAPCARVHLQGCPPNVVTCNTLIDVYGKSGQWEEALGGERKPLPPHGLD